MTGEYQKAMKSLHEDLQKAQQYTRKKLQAFMEAVASEHQGEIKRTRNELEEAKKAERTLQTAFDSAEDALQDAEQRLKDFVSSPFWVSRKRALSVLGGIILGLVVAITGQLGMLNMLGIDLTPNTDEGLLVSFLHWADIIITGLFIGTGSKFVHQAIGILQETKDTITDAGNLWQATARLRLPTVGAEGVRVEVEEEEGPGERRPRAAGVPPTELPPEPVGLARSRRRANRVLR